MKISKEVFNQINSLKLTSFEDDSEMLYALAQKEPVKSLIISTLKKVLSDKHVLGAIGDNYYWSDGSNGYINFSQFDHFLTDCGYRAFSEYPKMFISENSIEHVKAYMLSHFGSSAASGKHYESYKKHKYNPRNEFTW